MEALTIGVDDPGDFGDRVDSVLATREWNPQIPIELRKGSETELWKGSVTGFEAKTNGPWVVKPSWQIQREKETYGLSNRIVGIKI